MAYIRRTDKRQEPSSQSIHSWWCKNDLESWWVKFNQCDVGEPSCYACGWFFSSEKEPRDESEISRWNYIGLERCHLVDRSLGGSDDASNLVLLCHKCHKSMPSFDEGERDMAIMWVVGQMNSIDKAIAAINNLITAGYSLEELNEKFYKKGLKI